ncbi:MAG: GHKL domain-containing protein [Bacteroidia bacterium]|nr:GHKL domain-containing protein [Bacteroidia bacterium]
MKKFLNNWLIYLFLSLFVMVVLLFSDKKPNSKFLKNENVSLGKTLNKHINKKLNEIEQLSKNTELYEAIKFKNINSYSIKQISKKNFSLLCTKNDSIYFWNSNQPVSDSSVLRNNDSVFVADAGKNTYLLYRKSINEFKCYFIYKIADYSKIVELPTDHPFNGLHYLYNIKIDNGDGYKISLKNSNAHVVFFLKEIEGINRFAVFFGLLALFIFGFSVFKFIEKKSKNGLSVKNFILISSLFLLIRILLFYRIILYSLQNTEIFNPEIFASSKIVPSMGDLVLHLACFFAVFISFINIKQNEYLKILDSKYRVIKALILVLFLVFLSDMGIGIVKSLVIDSNITFHFADLPRVDIYSYLAMAIIGVVMGGIIFVVRYFIYKAGLSNFSLWNILFVFFISFLFYAVFQTFDAHLSPIIILVNIIYFSIIAFWNIYKIKVKEFYLNILVLLMISGFSAYIIYFQNQKHEEQYLNIFIDKIISEQDIEAESKFSLIDNELVREFITPQDFKDFIKHRDEYEKRIKNLFFSGYLDKFDLKILSFDSSHNSLNIDTRYSFKILDNIYLFKSTPTISTHFYKINNKTGIRGYIAKFETCNLEGSLGSVFLLLQPKLIQSSHSYPDIFSDKKQQNVFEFKDYSYSIYQNQKLVSQKGDYPYSLIQPKNEKNIENELSLSGYKHFVYKPQKDVTVIISKRKDYMVKSFAMFSFMFIFFTILGLVFSLLWTGLFIIRFGWKSFIGKNRHKTPFLDFLSRTFPILNTKQKLLSSRIQVSMVGLVFFGLIVSVFFTIQYVNYNYNQRQYNQLYLKLKEILNQLENEPELNKKLTNNYRIKALVNQLGDANRLDLNIFDKNGILLASTQPEIYSQYLLAPLMNPDALYKLRNKKISQLLQKEYVTNFDYISGYVPLLGDDNEIRAFLNLPYFTEKSEIDKEISSFLVSLINIYFLLLLIAIVVAYFIGQRISLPLQLIRLKLSKTTISAKNEIIDWKREDEIGQLVKQYNKMVLELEESANKLSESEREGAWREMAKQVAHEIKNPLTPMKLNIQYLQRAWQNKQNIDATFEKVTNILIEQIDSLSRMATEFSSFAQMPTDKYENCRVDEILLSTIHLFEQSENLDFIYQKNLKPITIYADPEQISRVFTNIIKNAIQSISSENEGKIEVDYKTTNDEVVISIKDNGSGIDDELKSKIFIPSFSTKNSGMGLGLAISKKIIEKCNGKIWFDSTKNDGSTFWVSFKIVK